MDFRRLKLLFTLVLVLVSSGAQSWQQACTAANVKTIIAKAKQQANPKSDVRTIRFPRYSLGGLYLIPSFYDGLPNDKAEFAVAKGLQTIEVPPDSELLLRANVNSLREPEFFDTLPPDSIDCLQIRATFLSDEDEGGGDRALVHVAHLTGLKRLMLQTINPTDAGLSLMKNCRKLERITVFVGSLTGSCFKDFKDLPALKFLDVTGNPIKPQYMHYLSQFPKLKVVELQRCNMNEESLKELGPGPTIEHLNISFSPKVNDDCLKYVANLKNLQWLDLSETKVTPHGLLQLQHLKHLKCVVVSPTYFPKSALAMLKTTMPNLAIQINSVNKPIDKDINRIFAPLR